MRYYIFRNNTLEPLFGNLDARYSGYGDISSLEEDILVDNEGKSLSIEAGKAELPAKFAQLLKL